jgi:hypothetical protein
MTIVKPTPGLAVPSFALPVVREIQPTSAPAGGSAW